VSCLSSLTSLRRTLWNERFMMMFGDDADVKKYQFLLDVLAPAA
jgi:hypothetical protein